MDEHVSAAMANRHFSELLRSVAGGHRHVVTSHGRPVAEVLPLGSLGQENRTRQDARERLLSRLSSQPAIDVGPWTRDELYDR
ncbi:MAG: type II toxin-antitoxin system prevent-host-death family antitoxin [Chloroflexi bacterium]|nr:type II toxin-antitoxin system prevent-host-death family antitoxin [Chloroflexota bacterium]